MNNEVEIFEVSLRDGLQALQHYPAAETRIAVFQLLKKAGLNHIELGSFVNPRLIPSMACSPQLFTSIEHNNHAKTASALIPNQKGFDLAIESGVEHMAFICSASDQFARRNMNCSLNEALDRACQLAKRASELNIPHRVYISCAFYDPWAGPVSIKRLRFIAQRFSNAESLVFSDTTGVATKEQIRALCPELKNQIHRNRIALHLHGKNSLELARSALHCGIRKFDSALNNLGGCPFAPNAPANLDTAELIAMLHQEGFKPSINLQSLEKAKALLNCKAS